MIFYTIGYQGIDSPEFVAALKRFQINVLADVRNSPHSRKKGFSKKSLREMLSANNVAYLGYPALGVPAEMREHLKNTGDYSELAEKYRGLLTYRNQEIDELTGMMETGKRIALMCYEHDPDQCHRKMLAEEIIRLSNNNFQVHHIDPLNDQDCS